MATVNPATWLRSHSGADAVVVRSGKNGAQLVIVDAEGAWERWVYRSVAAAESAAEHLDVPVHRGAYPDAVRLRMNARLRSREELDRGAYREQGRVGPVNPYPESRRRIPKKDPESS